MTIPTEIPDDIQQCQALARNLVEALVVQEKKIAELVAEQEKLHKLLSHFINGHRSEKHIVTGPNQGWLPFENAEELAAARAEAEAEVEELEKKDAERQKTKKKTPRDESLPSHLRRVEEVVEADDAVKNCPTHGERTIVSYDIRETLVYQRPEIFVLVRKYPKYACPGAPQCGVSSPERPTSLVEGDRYDTSVVAAIIEFKWFYHLPIYRAQDLFAGSGWTPARSTLQNLVKQAEFVLDEFLLFVTRRVQKDLGVGIDDTGCRMLLPRTKPTLIPGDAKSLRLAEKIAEAEQKKEDSLLAKMWAYSGLHLAPYNVFDFRVSRHRDGPDEFFRNSRCTVVGDCFSGNQSVVIQSDGRLKFAACWAHARRKFVEAKTYKAECAILLGMVQPLYDVETRAKEMSWENRQALRERESSIVLKAIRRWIDSLPPDYVLPKSDFAEALRYLNNNWKALGEYVQDGRIPIDNNQVERLMKQVAMGRKAWLFVGSVAGGEQSAKMMTLVSSARRHDLDVGAYVKDVLDRLLAGSTDYESLLPDVWKPSHPGAVREYRVEERRDKADRKQLDAARRRVAARSRR